MSEKSIAMYDIDRTAYAEWLLFPIVDRQVTDGIVKPQYQDELYKFLEDYGKGSFPYETMVDRVVRKWAEALKGQSAVTVQQHTIDFVEENVRNFRPFVKETMDLTCATHSSQFVTGEPQFVAAAVTGLFKAHGHVSSWMSIKQGVFTGEATRVLATKEDKLRAVKNLMSNFDKRGSMAFGDSIADVEMLAEVEHPVCVLPTRELRDVAENRGWFVASTSQEVSKYVRSVLRA